jgi:hypothetical protein
MAHFAKLDNDNKVLAVHVVSNEILLVNGVESEQVGINFLTDLHNYNNWKQTSYNGSFRKNYAGINDIYDNVKDAFISPQPYPSWALNESTCRWEPPVSMPEFNEDSPISWVWDETSLSWVDQSTILIETGFTNE